MPIANRNTKTRIMAGVAAALYAAQAVSQDRREAVTPDELVRRKTREAEAQRRGAKVSKKAATRDLVTISQRTLVLGHIHPRWLRAEVERRLDLGEDISAERVEQLRAIGAGR